MIGSLEAWRAFLVSRVSSNLLTWPCSLQEKSHFCEFLHISVIPFPHVALQEETYLDGFDNLRAIVKQVISVAFE